MQYASTEYMSTQLTIRGFSRDLEKRLHDLARREQLSLNKAAIKLMRRGAGLEASPSDGKTVALQLKKFSGSMSVAEAQRIDRAISKSRQDDLELQSDGAA